MSDNNQEECAVGVGSSNLLGTCKDCKHWGRTFLDNMDETDYRHCDYLRKAPLISSAHVAGYDEEGIETGANFGCILFTPNTEVCDAQRSHD
jgi:hypothetical protein